MVVCLLYSYIIIAHIYINVRYIDHCLVSPYDLNKIELILIYIETESHIATVHKYRW